MDSGPIIEQLAAARAGGYQLAISGGGTLNGWGGSPESAARPLSTSGLDQLVDYDPPELVLTAGPAIPVAAIESLLAAQQQMLAFEPMDYGPLFGKPAGGSTLGGIIAANAAGPRRVAAGSVRDHFIGLRAVAGNGDSFKAGGRVVKNVTGFDLPKLLAGSWGALAVLTEVSLRVVPAPRQTLSFCLSELSATQASAAMRRALQSPLEVSGCVHLSAAAAAAMQRPARPSTVLRLEGFADSVNARAQELARCLGEFGPLEPWLGCAAFWTGLRQCRQMPTGDAAIWRLSVPPAAVATLLEELADLTACWSLDWGGSLLWLATDAAVEHAARQIHHSAGRAGGQAQLIRGLQADHSAPDPDPPLRALGERVKQAFDPDHVLLDRRPDTRGGH